MARVIVASTADADVDGIFADLAATAGRGIARKYDALFDKLYDRLAAHPALGAPRPEIGPNIRIGIVSPYIIIYRHSVVDDTVTVLRITAWPSPDHGQAAGADVPMKRAAAHHAV